MSSGYLKCAGSSFPRRALYTALLAVLAAPVFALPQGGQVVTGSADITAGEQSLEVLQSSQRVVINYDSFNVAEGHQVNFVQPNADAVALNRVLGNDLSTIHGQINANGQVFLINPNGVLFGQGAEVNVGALVTSTLDIDNDDFMAGRDYFTGSANGQIINQGRLSASERAVLIAPEVINSGEITVPGGDVHLYSGQQVLVQPPGSGIALLVEESDLPGRLENSGEIHAGQVRMHLDTRSEQALYSSVINNSGLVRATAASGAGGSIELLAPGGDVSNTGTLAAQAESGAGGQVAVAAQRYGQTGHLSVAGSGLGHGGQVDVHTSETIVLHPGATVDANAGTHGKGGDVIFYSSLNTWYRPQAHISARGGSVAGDGGFVEVSGAEFVDVQSHADVGATQGESGLWYIDPTNIEIIDSGTDDGSFVPEDNVFTWTFNQPPPDTSRITINAIRTALTNGDVVIDTASTASGVGDISFAGQLNYGGLSSLRTLTLVADRDINFQGNSRIYDQSPGSEGLNVVLDAQRNIQFNSTSRVDVGSGTFRATAGENITVTDIASRSDSDAAIVLESLSGSLSGQLLGGEPDVGLSAPNGGIALFAATGIGEVVPIGLDSSRLGIGLSQTGVADVAVPGDLTITAIRAGGDAQIDISSGGVMTYTGALGSDLNSANGASITLSAQSIYMTRGLGQLGGDYTADIIIDAVTGLAMAPDALIHAGNGLIDVDVGSGGAQISGLSSLSSADDAIRLQVGGSLTGAGDGPHLRAPNGGAVIDGGGDIELVTEVVRIDATAQGGDITLRSVSDLEIVNLSALNSAELTVAGDLFLADGERLSADRFTVAAQGQIILPENGLTVAEALTLSAEDITDTANNRVLSLQAPELTLSTGAAGGDIIFNTSADRLDLTHTGANSLTVANTGPLQLLNAQPLGGTTIISTAEGNDLTLTQDINLQDANGALQLISGNHLVIDVDILDTSGAFTNNTNLHLQAANDISVAEGARVHAGTGNLSLQAVGGSIALGSLAGNELSLQAAGAITNAANGAENFTGNQLSLVAGAGMGSADNPLQGSVQSLSLQNAAGDVYYQNQGALSLSALSAGENARIGVLDGDLTLAASSLEVSGRAHLQTADNGRVLIQDQDLAVSGDLLIETDDLLSGDRTLNLSANHADLRVRNAADATIINSQFESLSLNYLGAASVAVNDGAGLSVTELNTGGDAVITSTSADLQLQSAPRVGGSLTLGTVASGDLILPAEGLSHQGTLALEVDNLRSPVSETVALSADSAVVRLRDGSLEQTWNTAFNQLQLSVAGSGALSINNSGALQIPALDSAGAVAISTQEGDLTLLENPQVLGHLSLETLTSGDLLLPESGLQHSGALSLVADRLLSAGDMSLSATDANIRLRTHAAEQTWQTDFDRLALDLAGGANLQITNQSALEISALAADADLTLSTADGDLTLSAPNSDVTGALSLTATGSGDLVLPAQGFTHATRLILEGNELRASGGGAVQINAAQGHITLRDAQSTELRTQFAELVLHSPGSAEIQLDNTGPLRLTQLASGGNVTLASAGDLWFEPETAGVAGSLALSASGGDVHVSGAGLTSEGPLAIQAVNLQAGETGPVRLFAPAVDLTLSGEQALALEGQMGRLDLSYASAEPLLVNTGGDLALGRFEVNNAQSVSTQIDGVLQLPETGLSVPGDWFIGAADLLGNNRQVSLAARDLAVHLTAPAGDSSWALAVERLQARLDGPGTLQVQSAGALTLADLQGTGRAIDLSDGRLMLALANGDLHILGDVHSRLLADGAGPLIDIDLAAGDLYLGGGEQQPVTVQSQRAGAPQAGEGVDVRLRLSDTSATDRQINLGAGSTLTAIGGDILLHTRPATVPASAERRVNHHPEAQVNAYNESNDPLTGTVLLNNRAVPAQAWQRIGAGRTLSILDSSSAPAPENVLDAIDHMDDDALRPPAQSPQAGANAEEQFNLLFGECNELAPEEAQRCRIHSAVKAFLSHWLVGGELPPKTEMPQ